jgi:hypothetical protein
MGRFCERRECRYVDVGLVGDRVDIDIREENATEARRGVVGRIPTLHP